jgi:hypothetical protein
MLSVSALKLYNDGTLQNLNGELTMATRPPVPGELLYENLFIRRDDTETIETLSQGLQAVHLNAARLIKDVELLVSAERYASASFLLATADEEIAKFYILADMCRLDFSRHQSILKRLCQAFYSPCFSHPTRGYSAHRGSN